MGATTPKAIINLKYGSKARYRTESVPEEPAEDAPKLLVPQPMQNKYRSCLELPEFSVTSGVFTKKKDAEQDAARLALEKLGIQPSIDLSANKSLTEEEKWQALQDRLSFTFSEKFTLSHCPLIVHFRAAVQREGEKCGLLPAAVLAAFDSKVVSLCKSINSKAETDPALALALVLKAVKSCSLLWSPLNSLWIGKREPFAIITKEKLINWTPEMTGKNEASSFRERTERCSLEAIYIPCSSEKAAESMTLNIDPHEYFMDVIANHLSLRDSSHVLISRTLRKAPLESRLYFPIPDSLPSVPDLDGSNLVSKKYSGSPECPLKFNTRASNLVGQTIHGDAILAAVGSSWRSFGTLSWENINLSSYYRMLLSRTPRGNYKISRDAILVTELPTTYTTRSRWHGALPRDLLTDSCHHYCLSEPEFSLSLDDSTYQEDSTVKLQNSNDTKEGDSQSPNDTKNKAEMLNENKCEMNETISEIQNAVDKDPMDTGSYICVVKILSKIGELIVECASEHSYRNRYDAIQSAALKALHHKYFSADSNIDSTLGKERVIPEISDHVSVRVLRTEPTSPKLLSSVLRICNNACGSHGNSSPSYCNMPFSSKNKIEEMDVDHNHEMTCLVTGGPNCDKSPNSGTIACISYKVYLLNDSVRECVEYREEFEFEFGTGAVIHQVEACVACISINESKCFLLRVPSQNEILAAAGEVSGKISYLSLGSSFLEYNVKLLNLMEPIEERMEQALFSPPLSKQRMEYALHLLSESHAKCLVDLGCGSGSLFDALLDQETDLIHIVGVDISQKSLSRAVKVLHSKLGMVHKSRQCSSSYCSASLYNGSITEPDERICEFDVATCIEVIEHMEEDQAFKFGECVLGKLCPRILMVSTPNVEYNPLLQRNVADGDGGKKESTFEAEGKFSIPCRFRNDDHKFEWTRKQFSDWAINLASRYGYSVEFGGVGGSGETEPGFASQIAVFKRGHASEGSRIYAEKCRICKEGCDKSNITGPYTEVWNWNADNL